MGICRVTESDSADNSIVTVDWTQSATEREASSAVGSAGRAGDYAVCHRGMVTLNIKSPRHMFCRKP